MAISPVPGPLVGLPKVTNVEIRRDFDEDGGMYAGAPVARVYTASDHVGSTVYMYWDFDTTDEAYNATDAIASAAVVHLNELLDTGVDDPFTLLPGTPVTPIIAPL